MPTPTRPSGGNGTAGYLLMWTQTGLQHGAEMAARYADLQANGGQCLILVTATLFGIYTLSSASWTLTTYSCFPIPS